VLTELIVTAVAGWLLFKGNAWGFLLGVASGVHWLWAVARVLQVSGGHPEASIYLVISCVILGGDPHATLREMVPACLASEFQTPSPSGGSPQAAHACWG
jgi:hypothetical protein